MIENHPTNVSSAFEMVLEEVEAEIDFVNGVGARAFEQRDYDRAKEALERSGTLTTFRDRLGRKRGRQEKGTGVNGTVDAVTACMGTTYVEVGP